MTPPAASVPLDVLDEAYRVLAAWANVETVPPQWQERMAGAAQRLYNYGARAASERVQSDAN